MSPEEKAHLRYMIRKAHQVPQPLSDLLARTTRKFSSAAQRMPSIARQAGAEERASEQERKDVERILRAQTKREAEQATKEVFGKKKQELGELKKKYERITNPTTKALMLEKLKGREMQLEQEKQKAKKKQASFLKGLKVEEVIRTPD